MTEPPDLQFQPLEWDTTFWRKATARLDVPADSYTALSDLADATRLAQGVYDFLQLLIPASRVDCVQLVERLGFSLVDLRCEVQLDRASASASGRRHDAALRPTQDLGRVEDLAAICHDNSRFAADPAIGPDEVHELYRRWIRRDAAKPGWTLSVAGDAAAPEGYVTFGPAGDRIGTIGLVGVHPSARGAGLGGQLVAHAVSALLAGACDVISVITQGGSRAAMQMYQASGFKVAGVAYWMHWHRSEGAR